MQFLHFFCSFKRLGYQSGRRRPTGQEELRHFDNISIWVARLNDVYSGRRRPTGQEELRHFDNISIRVARLNDVYSGRRRLTAQVELRHVDDVDIGVARLNDVYSRRNEVGHDFALPVYKLQVAACRSYSDAQFGISL